jgi:hypothetical protein
MYACFLVSLTFLNKIKPFGNRQHVCACSLSPISPNSAPAASKKATKATHAVRPRPSLYHSCQKTVSDLSMFRRSFPRSASVSTNILQVELCSRSVSKRISAKCHGLALLGMERCKSEKMSGLALRYRDEKQKR